MPLQSLPYELLSQITALLPTLDLLALTTTTHLLSYHAYRLLYSELYLSPQHKNLNVVITLAKKPSVAVHVRSFAIHIQSNPTLFKPFYKALRTALSNMSHLSSLRLFLDPSFTSALPVADNSIFSNLLNVATSLAYDRNVALCLARANSLLELDLESPTQSHSTNPELPVGSLPHLRKFTGPVQVAEMMVPGRPVESIRLHSGDILESVAINLAKSTTPVILFEANINSLSIPFLLSLSQSMPYLRYVRFTTTSCNIEPPSFEFCDDVAKTLSFFPYLEAFELWGIHWERTQKAPNNRGYLWRANLFCPSADTGELSSDLFSEGFTVY
ncbi:hypothetical protein AMATHDRAFT_56754 [Amanita thiersii Skay4041]|uniref:F-box domain-containing protein n=1 Tax=Amanita thiersii Skay4041 TaxID=703135 RepID=A0A2A9NRE6_9AGAR|nr:hypothetical protein AMATHDRAFT_56754 [Amanita thiersii Skay4041]